MEKLNIAEILKDCPKGMELDCTLFEGLEFDSIVDNEYLPIRCRIKHPNGGYNVYNFTKHGCWLNTSFAKCVIFPKGKSTWEGFQIPFKDGDILFAKSAYSWIFIYKESENKEDIYKYVALPNYYPNHTYITYDNNPLCCKKDVTKIRFATEEEKQKLFDAIKANGYKWNSETKTLEKLIEPKFKVGDRIANRNSTSTPWIVSSVSSEYYGLKLSNGNENIGVLPVSEQDSWELVPNKFDITTLKPFDKVLVRDSNSSHFWEPKFFFRYEAGRDYPYRMLNYQYFSMCIPYEGNEHLLGTTNDCDNFYKIWE